MATVDDVRRLALALPEAEEQPHFEKASFRVRGKIFATLPEDGGQAFVKVPEAEVRALAASDGAAFSVVTWGPRVAGVGVTLAAVDAVELRELLADAWRGVAPKRLAADHDGRRERLRSLCLALPEAAEKETWGDPTWRVRDKIFAMEKRGDGRVSVWCKAPPGEQEALVGSDPGVFFVPPYVGHNGWIGVRVDGDVDWDELAAIVEESWRMTAPKRLVKLLAQPTSTFGRGSPSASQRT